ncbi:MAG: sigma-54 interaction domain-containing protein, partial [Spirochaetota bacterium]
MTRRTLPAYRLSMKSSENTCLDSQRSVELLYMISQSLMRNDELKNVITVVLNILSQSSGVETCMVTILNRSTDEIIIKDAFGLSDEERSRGRYRIGEGITGRVVETGESFIVPRISEEPAFLNRTGSYTTKRLTDLSFVCMPVVVYGEVVGTISVEFAYNGIKLIDEYRMMLGVISAMIAQAVHLYQIEHEEKHRLMEENYRLHRELEQKYRPANIVGNSRPMRVLYNLIERVSKSNANLLIFGESGTGKELVAHAVHYSSARAHSPFIMFNCAALTETIIESELFGHEKGAFTGAIASRPGKFEQAHGGTIFLDEIGEMSLATQAKLLRVLQERQFERVGGTQSISIDVRVIAATNCDLEEMVKNGTFRADLFYRLNVFPVNVPPLRERKTDIVLLAEHFLGIYSELNGKDIKRISTPAIDLLMSYHWPGNVRELENCIERAVILSDDQVIHSYHLPPSLQSSVSTHTEMTGSLQKAVES